ncbi:GTPase [Photobacterium aquae]|uniref:GTPase n=1 Tax=Photobacterium aquae TaxID=1195763 RepID=UPI00069D35D1|nr:GTPase [Photobacterium aquae]
MKALATQIHAFAEGFTTAAADEVGLHQRIDEACRALTPLFTLEHAGKDNEMALEAEKLVSHVQAMFRSWGDEWRAAQPMRELSQQMADRFVLLVFGKVNAGKSSFINHLADRLSETLAVPASYFQLEGGKVNYIDGPLKEGATETTHAIQGIELGPHFVILDTPGLHSVTPENAGLTRRFTDTADAVVWLTPASNPGLVHELDELSEEIRLGKPVLPVISKSDTVLESIDASCGGLVQQTVAKSPENRQLQQTDVYQRATQHLAEHQALLARNPLSLRRPVSISVLCDKQYPARNETRYDSGLTELDCTLASLLADAKAYKCRKMQAQLNHFWQKKVLTPLEQQLYPECERLAAELSQQEQALHSEKDRLVISVANKVAELWPELVLKHQDSGDTQALSRELSLLIQQQVSEELKPVLDKFSQNYPDVDCSVSGEHLGQFQKLTASYQTKTNGVSKTAWEIAGTALGSALGLLGGPAGLFAGGIAGKLITDHLVDDEYEEHYYTIGVDISEVLAKGDTVIQQAVTEAIECSINWVIQQYIKPVKDYLADALAHIARLSDTVPHSG